MSVQDYLTVGQVAEKLAVSELTVRRRIADGEIPAVRLSTHRRAAVRIPADGLEAWLDSVRRPSNRDGPKAAA
jgi:excisionase family DNA binding protein